MPRPNLILSASRRWLAVFVAMAFVAGCAGRHVKAYSVKPDDARDQQAVTRAQAVLANLYPPQYRATQRAIITVGRRQYVCDGVLTVSPGQGEHLAVINTLGLVTELRLTPAGSAEVLKVTPLFREAWTRDYVARDLRRLFAPDRDHDAVGRLPDGRLVLENRPAPGAPSARYIFNPSGDRLEEIELSQKGKRIYLAQFRSYQTFAGFPKPVPSEYEVIAPAYRLHLRNVELSIPSQTSSVIGGAAP